MKPLAPSRTAEYMAFFRALESLRPASRRLFADPFAEHFIRPSLRRALRLSRLPVVGRFVDWYADRRLPGARTSAIARTRLIDDALLPALQTGIGQVVILGAGFDCRGYRLAPLRAATVFEVDYPATLGSKLSGLRQIVSDLPEHVRFVEIDFNQQGLPEVLSRAGFDPWRAAVFLWEGVTNYLTADAVDAVLHFVAACHSGTRLIFTYVDSAVLDGGVRFQGAARILEDVARLNEPWTFGLSPDQVPAFLCERGLSLHCDFSADEYRKLYFGAASQWMKGYEFYHVAVAQVPEGKERIPALQVSMQRDGSNA